MPAFLSCFRDDDFFLNRVGRKIVSRFEASVDVGVLFDLSLVVVLCRSRVA
jgi:hypothetical protein